MTKPEHEFFPVSNVHWTPLPDSKCTGLTERVLAADQEHATATRILRFAPGTDTTPNGVLTHDFWEEVYIIEGSIHDLTLDQTFTAGEYACRPPGMPHGPWISPEGCMTFEVRYMRSSTTTAKPGTAHRLGPDPSSTEAESSSRIPPVVDLAWWQAHKTDVVLADVRWYLDGRSGRDAYDQGHLPGAVHVDLGRWLSGAASPEEGRNPLPDPAVFAEGMGRLGIGDDDTVVAYDDAGGVIAARMVWMLRAIGHSAALLDGGLSSYHGPLEQISADRRPVAFTPRAWPQDRLAGIEDAADRGRLVLDARPPSRYSGEHEPLDPRAGHIPGARSLPCTENLDGHGRFLPTERLRRRFVDLGIEDAAGVVSYCGSGANACHNLLALELAGMGHGRLYPGSWSHYSHTTRPAATGDAPG